MKITDIIPDIIGTDLWIAVYSKTSRAGSMGSAHFLNFVTISGDNLIFKRISEMELLVHGRYLDPDSSLFLFEYTVSWENADKCYDVIEPLELYTFDEILQIGWENGKE